MQRPATWAGLFVTDGHDMTEKIISGPQGARTGGLRGAGRAAAKILIIKTFCSVFPLFLFFFHKVISFFQTSSSWPAIHQTTGLCVIHQSTEVCVALTRLFNHCVVVLVFSLSVFLADLSQPSTCLMRTNCLRRCT